MNLANIIDHTLLKPTATKKEILELCNEAIKYNFYSVCINPYYVKLAKEYLYDSDVKVCTVVGFPLGSNTLETKIFEASTSVTNGADEIDMVINISELKNLNKEYCLNEINSVKEAIGDKVLKVIVETDYLTDEEKVFAAELILESNADYIKTSTGFAKSGANINDIILWNGILKNNKLIKASGGIGTYEDAVQFVQAGVSRLGTSRSIQIINNEDNSSNNDY